MVQEEVPLKFKNIFQERVSKKWVVQRCSKTQGSKQIFKEMIKIKFGSLEKRFSKQEMVMKKRKCKGNEAWNSNNGGRGREKRKKKKKKKKLKGGQISPPPPLPLSFFF